MSNPKGLPSQGKDKESVLSTMHEARQRDVRWREGQAFSLVFHAGDEIGDFVKEAYTTFFSENGLNPTAFPSLRKFETDVISMTAGLLGGDASTVGNMTSGGTESILMAVKTARDWARIHRPVEGVPEIVLPVSAHPAFHKAAHYFDLRPVYVPTGPDFRADVAAMGAAITPNTILIVGSAPSYPHGVVDPITEIAALAQEHGLLCHVDACVGGFMLPFVRKLGYPVPDFDFSVAGVTSLSVDLHKYGYAAKGASVVLFRTPALRKHMFHVTVDWPGGIYASPTMTGTRPGGAIAAAWAIMQHLGEAGYLRLAQEVMAATVRIRDGINATQGIHIVGAPAMSVMAIAADDPARLDVYAIGDEMGLRGWHLDRQQFPPTLHVTVNYAHVGSADRFLADLWAVTAHVQRFSMAKLSASTQVGLVKAASKLLPDALLSRLTGAAGSMLGGGDGLPTRSAAMYGMMAELPNRGDVGELVAEILDGLTRSNE